MSVRLHTKPDGNVTEEFANLLVQLAAGYPTTGKLTEASIRVYAAALGDLPMDRLRAAAGRAVRESKFFPSAAELRGYAQADAEEQGVLAWAAFRQAAADVGAYASLEVEDGCAASALLVAFGSWAAYCETEDGPALQARRPEFLAAYRDALRRRGPAPCPHVRLPGLCEETGNYAPQGVRVMAGRLTAAGTVLVGEDVRQAQLPGGIEPEEATDGDEA